MDIALRQDSTVDLFGRIKEIVKVCKVEKLEQLLSDFLEDLPQESPINYVGELNKNDVML